jgi:hypothetical protein
VNLVLAGDSRQFDYYIRSNGLDRREFRYVQSARLLRSMRGAALFRVGTWWANPASREVGRLMDEGYFSSVTDVST